mmetsp:Transcript_106787/g.297241  ORF Transcript_106787/g.297241 Transcript_106787/m.297241 type:complete len:270 (-) Transcript_106787:53-862(-)
MARPLGCLCRDFTSASRSSGGGASSGPTAASSLARRNSSRNSSVWRLGSSMPLPFSEQWRAKCRRQRGICRNRVLSLAIVALLAMPASGRSLVLLRDDFRKSSRNSTASSSGPSRNSAECSLGLGSPRPASCENSVHASLAAALLCCHRISRKPSRNSTEQPRGLSSSLPASRQYCAHAWLAAGFLRCSSFTCSTFSACASRPICRADVKKSSRYCGECIQGLSSSLPALSQYCAHASQAAAHFRSSSFTCCAFSRCTRPTRPCETAGS